MLFTFANFMVTLFDSVERMNHEGDDWIRIEFSIVLRCQFQYNTYQHTILTLLLPIFVHFGISFLFVALSRIGFIDHVDNLVYNLTPVVLVSSYFLFHIFRYVLVSYSQLSILLLLLLLSMSLKHVTDKYVPLFLY